MMGEMVEVWLGCVFSLEDYVSDQGPGCIIRPLVALLPICLACAHLEVNEAVNSMGTVVSRSCSSAINVFNRPTRRRIEWPAQKEKDELMRIIGRVLCDAHTAVGALESDAESLLDRFDFERGPGDQDQGPTDLSLARAHLATLLDQYDEWKGRNDFNLCHTDHDLRLLRQLIEDFESGYEKYLQLLTERNSQLEQDVERLTDVHRWEN